MLDEFSTAIFDGSDEVDVNEHVPEGFDEDFGTTLPKASVSRAIRLIGGLGDAIILAELLDRIDDDTELFVKPNHVAILQEIMPNHPVHSVGELLKPEVAARFHKIVEASGYLVDQSDPEDLKFFETPYRVKAAEILEIEDPESVVKDLKWYPPAAETGLSVTVGRLAPILIHAGASNPNRRLPVIFWKRLIRDLRVKFPNRPIKFVGGYGDPGLTGDGVSCFWTEEGGNDLSNVRKLMNGSFMFFGTDSGMAHLAASVGLCVYGFETCTPLSTAIPNIAGVPRAFGKRPKTVAHLSRRLDPACSYARAAIDTYKTSRYDLDLREVIPAGPNEEPLGDYKLARLLLGVHESAKEWIADTDLEDAFILTDIPQHIQPHDAHMQYVVFVDGEQAYLFSSEVCYPLKTPGDLTAAILLKH